MISSDTKPGLHQLLAVYLLAAHMAGMPTTALAEIPPTTPAAGRGAAVADQSAAGSRNGVDIDEKLGRRRPRLALRARSGVVSLSVSCPWCRVGFCSSLVALLVWPLRVHSAHTSWFVSMLVVFLVMVVLRSWCGRGVARLVL